MTVRRIRFVVRGRVQGVGFRWATRNAAKAAGVVGWVQNQRDGSVTGEAQGGDEVMQQFRAFLRAGPPGSRVDAVEETDIPAIHGATDFVIERGR